MSLRIYLLLFVLNCSRKRLWKVLVRSSTVKKRVQSHFSHNMVFILILIKTTVQSWRKVTISMIHCHPITGRRTEKWNEEREICTCRGFRIFLVFCFHVCSSSVYCLFGSCIFMHRIIMKEGDQVQITNYRKHTEKLILKTDKGGGRRKLVLCL